MFLSILACAIFAVWMFLVIQLSWDETSSKIGNIIHGIIVFIFIGAAYLFPAWLLFWR